MKHLICDYCGFPAGSFKLIEGKNACIECQNRIYSLKQKTAPTVGCAKPLIPERNDYYGKQLKFNYYE
jgi:hypothetical protein